MRRAGIRMDTSLHMPSPEIHRFAAAGTDLTAFAALNTARVWLGVLDAACFASSLRTYGYACAPCLAFALRNRTRLAKQADA